MRSRLTFAVVVAALAVLVAGVAARTSVSGAASRPLIGMNLVLHEYSMPNCWGGHIILEYDKPGVREKIASALHAMRAAGVETLRLQVVFGPTPDPQYHWPIDSSSGHLIEPYRTNLGRFLDDIRKAGFVQVTVMFNPWGPNDPIGYSGDPYDPSLFDGNWTFMQEVHDVVVAHWPRPLNWDVIGEGAPARWQFEPHPLADYVQRMWVKWVDAYGAKGAGVSSVGLQEWVVQDRLQNLIDVLRATGRPLPAWFDIHPTYGSNALDELRAADRVLRRNGLTQPLAARENGYENKAAARAIATFVHTSKRRVPEVSAWPLYTNLSIAQARCPQLPLHMDAYWRALRGGPPPKTLHGAIDRKGRISLRTAFGQPVRSLREGTYTVTIRDLSRSNGFRLASGGNAGKKIDRRTGIRFRGRVTWTVRLRGGGHYSYSSRRHRVSQTFDVWQSD